MHVRRIALLVLALGLLTPAACLRKQKSASGLRSANQPLPAPTPPLPTAGRFAELPPAPASGRGVQPPKLELSPGSLPPLPGMPGSPSQPIPNSVPDSPQSKHSSSKENDRLILVSADDDQRKAAEEQQRRADEERQRKGLLERLRERRREREKKGIPELPPAVVPKKEKEETAEAEKEMPKADPKLLPPVVPGRPAVTPPHNDSTVPPETETTKRSSDLQVIRGLVDDAAKKFATVEDFEAKLVKRETVGGKKQPTEEMRFLYRDQPFSVRLTVTGEHGRGREVVYVKGQNSGKLVIVTGEGDNRLLGAGRKLELDPDSPLATSRTRGRIEDSGLGRPIRVLTKFVEEAEQGTRPADSVRSLGSVRRPEFITPVDGVEVTLSGSDDPLLPKGGKRQYYFDADPKSPSYRLPVLVITYEPNDSEVEYYCFTDFKLPARLTDADFNAERLGRRR